MSGRILAIDPGTTRSAYVVWDPMDRHLVAYGLVENGDLLGLLPGLLRLSGLMGIEMIASYGAPVGRSVFDTCVWIGRFCEAARGIDPGVPVVLEYRKDVVRSVTGSVRGNDTSVRRACIDRLGGEVLGHKGGDRYALANDEWQALGLALHLDTKFNGQKDRPSSNAVASKKAPRSSNPRSKSKRV